VLRLAETALADTGLPRRRADNGRVTLESAPDQASSCCGRRHVTCIVPGGRTMRSDAEARSIWILMLGALVLLLVRIGIGSAAFESSAPTAARAARVAR
jgi:hypothetical protein